VAISSQPYSEGVITMSLELSIITPCFNEVNTVENCAERVAYVLAKELPDVKYEHIFADNASTDGTVDILKEIASKDARVKVVVNSRNIGPFRNIYYAMSKAKGRAIIPMLPADLQDPVEVIPEFYKLWKSGYLVVYGERTNRQESLIMRLTRNIYYRIIRRFADTEIPLNAGEFMLIDSKVSTNILALDDYYPYIRGLVAQSTSKSATVKYTWGRREQGYSKANLINLFDQAINGLISTSKIPARIALFGGFVISGIGFLLGIVSLTLALLNPASTQKGIPTLIVGFFIVSGIQLFFLGLIGEYILSIHSQVRRQPRVFDTEVINF